MNGSTEARSPYALFDEVENARDVLILTYTANLDFFERFALGEARALRALVTVISDATMVRADPFVVRRAGVQYLDGRAVCPGGTAFHPKLLVVVGNEGARVAIGSGNLTTAGWHGNAETWTVLRANSAQGPTTLRMVADFLRQLSQSGITLSNGSKEALFRVAGGLDRLPADDPGPGLFHSLEQPILDQLPSPGSVEELVLFAPFHDARLDGIRALLDRLEPKAWTAYVQPETVVDGPALEKLCSERGGRLAWIAERQSSEDGAPKNDPRYWHGKLVQWRTSDGDTWALTGSPNLSRPALLSALADGGNCELAVLSRVEGDLRPEEGDPPTAGVSRLIAPAYEAGGEMPPTLLSATVEASEVVIRLCQPLNDDGTFERYDLDLDRWTLAGEIAAGELEYRLASTAVPIGRALRLRTAGGLVSNEVFVTDLGRVLKRQYKAVGQARTTIDRIVEDDVLGDLLLHDIAELRGELLKAGATVETPTTAPATPDSGPSQEGPTLTRPAPGQTLEEFLEACDPVLGRQMCEFALVLPSFPGVGLSEEEEAGALDVGEDEEESTPEPDEKRSLRKALEEATPDQRGQFRRFVERLVKRSPALPLTIRNLSLRTIIHSIGGGIWSDEDWPPLLARALEGLAAPGDEPNEWELRAAGSLASVSLFVLRSDVPLMSERGPHLLQFEAAANAVTPLLEHRDSEQIQQLTNELPGRLTGPSAVSATEDLAIQLLDPPDGLTRASRLLKDEHELSSRREGRVTLIIEDPVSNLPEIRLATAVHLVGGPGPTFVRALTEDGREVLAAWQAPWFAVEKETPAGKTMVRCWKLSSATPYPLTLEVELARATITTNAGDERPDEVAALLVRADADSGTSRRF